MPEIRNQDELYVECDDCGDRANMHLPKALVAEIALCDTHLEARLDEAREQGRQEERERQSSENTSTTSI